MFLPKEAFSHGDSHSEHSCGRRRATAPVQRRPRCPPEPGKHFQGIYSQNFKKRITTAVLTTNAFLCLIPRSHRDLNLSEIHWHRSVHRLCPPPFPVDSRGDSETEGEAGRSAPARTGSHDTIRIQSSSRKGPPLCLWLVK